MNTPGDDILSRLEKGNQDFLIDRANKGIGCHKCNYRGYTIHDNKAANCECWYKRTVERMCAAANIPDKYIGLTLEDNWNIKMDANNNDIGNDATKKMRIKRCVAQYIKNIVPLCAGLKLKFPNGDTVLNLLLIGESSSGKTLLSAIIAQEAIKKGLIVSFINWVDLEPIFSDFEAREEQNRIIDECKNADLVIIDGVENLNINNAYFFSGLERISNARINKGQPTVISAFENYIDIKGKHNWTSLLNSAHKIYLPPPKQINEITSNSPSSKINGRVRKASDKLSSPSKE